MNPVRRDKVTVEVISVSDFFAEGEHLTIACRDTQADVNFSSVPRAAVLLITNHSEHIVSLGQTAHLTGTVIILEDEFGHGFRLFSEESWKKDLTSRIRDFYDKSLRSAVASYRSAESPRIEDYADQLAGPYSTEYQRYVRNFRINSVLQLLNPFWWTGVALVLLPGDSDELNKLLVPSLDARLSPDLVGTSAEREYQEDLEREIAAAGSRVSQARDDCLAKAEKLALTDFVPMIMSGTFPSINILPHRQLRIYVPFEEIAEYPRKLHLRVFDLVTDHDAAGMPTRRSNFAFELLKVDATDDLAL